MGPMNIKNAKYRSQKQMGLAIVVLSLVFLGGEREKEREREELPTARSRGNESFLWLKIQLETVIYISDVGRDPLQS